MYDTEWFINRVKNKRPKDYKDYGVLGVYINSHTKIKIKHNKCGKVFEITPNSFLNGRGCRECGIKKQHDQQKLTPEEFNKRLPSYIHSITDYKSAYKVVMLTCDKCKSNFKVIPHDFYRNMCCKVCEGRPRIEDTLTYKSRLFNMVGSEYSLLSDFVSVHDHVKLKHNTCGNTYSVTPHNFNHGRRCPFCKYSLGEKLIKDILEDNNINYDSQKSFEDLKDINKLSYDYYLPEYHTLIEYQGEQHYHARDYFGGQPKYLKQVYHDNLKREYAKNNNYNLIEIPYTINTYDEIRKIILDIRKAESPAPKGRIKI